MYQVVALFDVAAERQQEFIDAALQDGRDSLASETGTRRFELFQVETPEDEGTASRFALNVGYDDEAAFALHAEGPHFKRFFALINGFAKELKDSHLRIMGTRIEDTLEVDPGPLSVFRIDNAYEQLSAPDEGGKFTPPHPEHFNGTVRSIDLADEAGLTGVEILVVFFEADARTKPHSHPTEQLLHFVRGNGFVAFPGQDEQPVAEGGIVLVPACELHMHGATKAGPACHVAARLPSKTNWAPRVPAEWRPFAESLSSGRSRCDHRGARPELT